VEQLPPFEDYAMKNRTYRFFTGQPLYPFGYGLSYTKFTYSNLKLSATALKAGETLQVDADVRNTGLSDGDEVTELYLEFPAVPGVPIRALRGFTRAHLKARETQHLQFLMAARDLSMVSEAGERLVASGAYRVSVGGGQPGTAANVQTTAFTIEGKVELPE
jgi:beta-glucosidase